MPEIGEATYDIRGSKSFAKNKPLSSFEQEPLVMTDRYDSSMVLASPVFMNLLLMILQSALYFSGQKSFRKTKKKIHKIGIIIITTTTITVII